VAAVVAVVNLAVVVLVDSEPVCLKLLVDQALQQNQHSRFPLDQLLTQYM
tara:strand:+ start:137 stop:286 length:150 start_codon:yes stop_codon:yes gene_type:complete